MDLATAALSAKLIEVALIAQQGLKDIGINYREVMEAQEAAALEGRELSADERQVFIDQAQSAVNDL